MKKQLPNLLGALVHDYFTDHLPRVRGASPHTIHSYRDSLVLLLRFLSARNKRPVVELDLKDLDPPAILAFLSHLERERKNGAATRSAHRLSCSVSFRGFAQSRTSAPGPAGSQHPLQTGTTTRHRLPGAGRDRIDPESDRSDNPARSSRLRPSGHHVQYGRPRARDR